MQDDRFRVRVYVNESAPMVIPGGRDSFGVYLETRQASGDGYYAIPAKRVDIDPDRLKPLPPGSDADFEFIDPLTSEAFK
jgi:hypothetical protein